MANEVTIVQTPAPTLEIVTGGAQGVPGADGTPGNISTDHNAAVPLSGHRMVTLDSNGLLIYASAETLAHANRVIGMTMGAVSAGVAPSVIKSGEITEPTWNWDTSLPLYLGANGLLTQTPPVGPTTKFSNVIGFPISPITVFIGIQPSIILT